MSKELNPPESQPKRSKRRKRNHISDKERVESVKQFGVYAREVEKAYKARYPKKPVMFL